VRILIVDLSSVFYPRWHAGADRPVGFAFESSVSCVRDAARDFDRVIVACDSGRCFRHDLSPAYKAGRAEREPAMIEQLRRTQDTLVADGYAVIKADGFEADDIVASCVTQLGDGHSFEILSSDKDLLALVGPNVRVRSVSTNAIFGPDEVTAKYHISPHHIRDYLTLTGDASDGVKGVPGVGPKNAARLLGQFGSLSGIIEALEAKDEDDNPVVKPPGILSALCAAKADGSLELTRKLITLRTDVPLDVEAALTRRAPQPQRPDFGEDLEPDEEDDVDDAEFEPTPTPEPERSEPQHETSAPQPPAPSANGKNGEAALVVREPETEVVEWSRSLEPRTMKHAAWLAAKLFESRLFSSGGNSGYGSPEQVLTVMLAGREMGLGAVTALRGIYVVKGKIAMGSNLMMGLVLSSGKCEYFDLVESTATKATYATKRKGGRREVSMTFTIEQARQIGLLIQSRSGEPTQWDKDPENMLRHRAASRLSRAVYPDIVANCYLPDELEES
jgi:5'-3' exonuclease